jgi:pimeloyl-ACP methyl ester carboxylesterase
MTQDLQFLDLPGGKIAYRAVTGCEPTVLWLGGFGSDLEGTKAQVLSDWAQAQGRAFIRFDYLGHGRSEGRFVDGTISRWRQDALHVIDTLTDGPLILVGSSMGAWIACLAAVVRSARVAGMVLIDPAADFTSALVEPQLSPDARHDLARDGVWLRPSDYGDPQPISRALLEDGARWSILPGPIPIAVPVRILQGREDPDVPWAHALALFQALESQDQVFSLIRDGDHRLSRPSDLKRIIGAVEELATYSDAEG